MRKIFIIILIVVVFAGASLGYIYWLTNQTVSDSAPAVLSQTNSRREVQKNAGNIQFVLRTTPETDKYTDNPSIEQQKIIQQKYWRMEVFSSYFDNKLSWYPSGWVYKDSYAVYRDSDLALKNDDWILKDKQGNRLYIPWGCNQEVKNVCPQYAGDFGNPAFRKHWIAEAKTLLYDKNYKGLWVDDVNMDYRVGNGKGDSVAPLDPRTNQEMTEDNWRKYMAEFMEEIRAAFHDKEILHNSLWFAGGYEPSAMRDKNPLVIRQQQSADYINREGGFNDDGLTGGGGEWSLETLLSYIDRLHEQKKAVIIDNFDETEAQREYSLAGYFLINNGRDGYGNAKEGSLPDNWSPLFNVKLGDSVTSRYKQTASIWRRDFERGTVLLGEPGAMLQTIELKNPMYRIDGEKINKISIEARQGVILLDKKLAE